MPSWDEIYADETAAPVEPHPWVVGAAERMRARGLRRILDLGCGAGRHVGWLGHAGFEVFGTDESARGLGLARRRLGDCRLARTDMRELPLRAASFDAVVSIHVLYHSRRAGITRALGEIRRVLAPRGLLVATFLSTRTWKHGEGERLEEGTFVQARGPEAGVPHHYVDEAGLSDLLGGFVIEALELEERLDDAGARHSHHQVIARRV